MDTREIKKGGKPSLANTTRRFWRRLQQRSLNNALNYRKKWYVTTATHRCTQACSVAKIDSLIDHEGAMHVEGKITYFWHLNCCNSYQTNFHLLCDIFLDQSRLFRPDLFRSVGYLDFIKKNTSPWNSIRSWLSNCACHNLWILTIHWSIGWGSPQTNMYSCFTEHRTCTCPASWKKHQFCVHWTACRVFVMFLVFSKANGY